MPSDAPDPQAQKQALIKALNEHRVNTIGELRRIERLFATMGSSDLTQPMTSACMTLSGRESLLAKDRALNNDQGPTTSTPTAYSQS